MESNILSGGLEDLNGLKNILLELDGFKDNNDALVTEEEKLEKAIKFKEKAIADEIAATSKSGRMKLKLLTMSSLKRPVPGLKRSEAGKKNQKAPKYRNELKQKLLN